MESASIRSFGVATDRFLVPVMPSCPIGISIICPAYILWSKDVQVTGCVHAELITIPTILYKRRSRPIRSYLKFRNPTKRIEIPKRHSIVARYSQHVYLLVVRAQGRYIHQAKVHARSRNAIK